MKFSGFRLWAAASVLAIAVISFTWWDESDIIHSSLSLIAAVTGVMYTMLAGRGMVACYFFGLINAPITPISPGGGRIMAIWCLISTISP